MQMISQQPKISIITVCFNSAKTIRRTIESVLNQTYNNIEYIIVDGKSTDNTLEIIKEYETKFAEKSIIYRYISEPDSGIYDAMNKGIKMATGEWVGIINSDDWYSSKAIETIVKYFHVDIDIDMIAGICAIVNTIGNRYEILEYYQSSFESIRYYGKPMSHPSIFVKRDVYLIKLYDTSFRIAADFDLCAYLAMNHYKCAIIDDVISYFSYGCGVSSKDNIICSIENLNILLKYSFISRSKYRWKLFILKIKLIYRKFIL